MGLFGKVKLAAKNADSKMGEGIDKGKVKSKIADENKEIDKLITKIGNVYYEAFGTDNDVKGDLDAICNEINQRKAKIAEYEEEIKKIEEEGQKEREQNKLDAEAEAEARKQAKVAKEESEADGLVLEVLNKALENYLTLEEEGFGDLGTQALIKHYTK